MLSTRASTHGEITGLTALRGGAAIWVMLFHYRNYFDFKLGSIPVIGPIIEKGYLAVDLFFILSGFVMYYVYTQTFNSGTFRYGKFLQKRMARLYPVHFVTMIAAICMCAASDRIGANTGEAGHWITGIIPSVLLLQAFGIADGLYLNFASWSISAEFFAYLLFPLLMYVIIRVPRAAALPVVCTFTVFYFTIADGWLALSGNSSGLTSLSYDYGIARIVPEFVLGVGLGQAIFRLEWRSSQTGFLSVVAAISALLLLIAFGAKDVVFMLVFAALIGAIYLWQCEFKGPVVYMGQVSYSLYMVHWLAGVACCRIIERYGNYGNSGIPVWYFPVFLSISITGAIGLFHLIEQPGRDFLLQQRFNPIALWTSMRCEAAGKAAPTAVVQQND